MDICLETIPYIPYNDTSEGFVAINTSLLAPRTCVICHYPNGSSNIANHYYRVGSPSSYVEIFSNSSNDDFKFESGTIEPRTSFIGRGIMNSLWIQCLSSTNPSYSPTLRLTLASECSMTCVNHIATDITSFIDMCCSILLQSHI